MFKFKFKFLFIFLTMCVTLSLIYNKFVLPAIIDTSEKYAVTEINKQINNTYNNIISVKKLTQSDFTEQNENAGYISTDTVVVNSLCGEMAVTISENLNNIPPKKVKIPIGLFMASRFFENIGPEVNMYVTSMGDAEVDYESSFQSCGVNQVNYKLWLNVKTEVSVINPFVNKKLRITRKIPVIDMVYNGGIPNSYINVTR